MSDLSLDCARIAVRPPGPPVSWLDVFREPLRSDPEVVINLIPINQPHPEVREVDGVRYVVCEHRTPMGNVALYGLHIVEPQIADYPTTAAKFAELGVEMARPHYIGKLSGVPDRIMMMTAWTVLVFVANKMHARPFNLKHEAWLLTEEANVN